MTTTLAQLHALQRQAGARTTSASRTVPSGSTATLHADRPAAADIARLRALLRLHTVRAIVPRASPTDRRLPGEEIAPGLHLVRARMPVDPLPASLGGGFDRRPDFDPARVLFFDTETTGLSGGTGTRAFMVGAAQWRAGALEVRQLILATLAAERAMLAEFARWLAPGTILASYNGKSYDTPLLRTRYRLARLPDPTAGLEHVDLLYPSRRRWRGVYENCRLCTIERRVLHILREDDLPGSEAPAAWLTYLHGGSAHNLCRVAAHNHQDVVSLARLMRHLAGAAAAAAVQSFGKTP